MTTTLDHRVTSDIDPFSDDFLSDPYADHDALRDAAPVVYLERYDVWAAARFAEVSKGLGDHATFCSSAGVGLSDFRKEKPWRPPSLLLEADPPDHTVARRVVTQVLTPGVVRSLHDAFLAGARAIIADLVGRGGFDGVADLAMRFPLSVFPGVVGLPEEGRENLLPYGAMVFNGFGPQNAHFEQAMARASTVAPWIAANCEQGALRPGSLGAQIHERAREAGYTSDEGARIVRSFLSAGFDTTVHGIGNAVWCLATNPEQWNRLKQDPSLVRSAFEESVRYESPVQTFFRTSTVDTVLGDQDIPVGEKVLFFLGAANRDPRHWGADAERYDITRKASGHVGFGVGIHACIGQMIARLEAECVLTALIEQVDEIELTGPTERQLNNTLRGFESIPLSVTPK